MKTKCFWTVACMLMAFFSKAVAQPVVLTKVGQWAEQPLGPGSAIAISGDHAYVAAGSGGLHVVNINDPTNPVATGFVSNSAESVFISGNYAYMAARPFGSSLLKVIDISDPANPVNTGDAETSLYAQSAVASGNHVYVTYERFTCLNEFCDPVESRGGLEIFDLSDPTRPMHAGGYEFARIHWTRAYCRAVAISDNYAYLGFGGDFWVIDINNRTNPTPVGVMETFHMSINGIAVSGNYAYAAIGGGLDIINISNPTSPTAVGSFNTGSTLSLAVQDNYAYVGTYSGLRVIDVSDPANPVFAAGFGTSAITGIAVRGNYVYVVESDLQILRVDVLPELSAELLDSQLSLIWPTNAANFVLESTMNLSETQWGAIDEEPDVLNGFYRLSVPATNPAVYFRLRSDENP